MRATRTGSGSKTVERALVLCLSFALFAACRPEFQPYNELRELRVMGVRADQPWFGPDEVANLDVLIHNPNPDAELTYQWNWCPLSSASGDGFQCQISEEDLASFGVPFLPYDLGTEPTAAFPYPTHPEALRTACQMIAEQGNLPDFVPLPDCEKGFPVTISLDVSDGTTSIRAVKEMVLLYDPDDERNTNPVLTGFAVQPDGGGEAIALLPEPTVVARLERNLNHRFSVDLSESSSEEFTPSGADEPTRESLVVTWFVEGGELEKIRTSYYPGETTLESAETNDWTTPTADDFEPGEMRVYTVLRDGRGGIDWISSRVALE